MAAIRESLLSSGDYNVDAQGNITIGTDTAATVTIGRAGHNVNIVGTLSGGSVVPDDAENCVVFVNGDGDELVADATFTFEDGELSVGVVSATTVNATNVTASGTVSATTVTATNVTASGTVRGAIIHADVIDNDPGATIAFTSHPTTGFLYDTQAGQAGSLVARQGGRYAHITQLLYLGMVIDEPQTMFTVTMANHDRHGYVFTYHISIRDALYELQSITGTALVATYKKTGQDAQGHVSQRDLSVCSSGTASVVVAAVTDGADIIFQISVTSSLVEIDVDARVTVDLPHAPTTLTWPV